MPAPDDSNLGEANDAYRTLRRKVADLSFTDSFRAIWALLQFKQLNDFKLPKDIEAHNSYINDTHAQPYPWQLETITQEVIRHAGETERNGRSLRKWTTLAETVNAVRAVEDKLLARYLAPGEIMHELLRIAHQQFLWQRCITSRSIGRNYRIFNTDAINAISEQKTGLTVPKIYFIGTALWGHYANKPFLQLPWQSEIAKLPQSEIDKFIALYSADFYKMRQSIKLESTTVDQAFGYDHRHIRRTPVVRFRHGGKDFLACPLPTLLAWRFTSGLYYDLISEPSFSNEFGAAFQGYVGQALTRALNGSKISVTGEKRFGSRKRPKDTVDWIVIDEDAAAFVECKAKRLTLRAKTLLTDKQALLDDVNALARYIVQVYQTITQYQQGNYPSLAFDPNRRIYPVITTPENWFPLGRAFWTLLSEAVNAQMATAGLPTTLRALFPYTLASVEELELAAQILPSAGVRDFFENYHSPQYAEWMLEGYMSDRFGHLSVQKTDLFPESFDEFVKPFE